MAHANARPAVAAAGSSAIPISRRRRFAVWLLVVVASLLLLVTVLAVYVKRQMLDNQAWTRASAQVIQSPQVRAALSTYLVNQLYTNVDVAQALERRLPTDLKRLATPLAGALRQPAVNGTELLLARPRVQKLFVNASSVAHNKLVNVLENKTGYGISTGNGVVTLNLHALIEQLGAELGVPAGVLAKAPANAGEITILRSDQLDAAQKAVRLIRVLSVWLFVLVLGLYALAVYLARGRRRATLRNVGWSFVVVGVVLLIVRRVVGNYTLDAIASPTYRASIHDVWLIETAILGQIAGAAIVYGAVTVAGAVLAGPTRAATWIRRGIAPTLNNRPGLAAGAVAFAYLLVILWGPTHALRTWWGILLFGGLIAAGVLALRRQTLAEFADAGRPGLAETLIGRLPASRAPQAESEPSPADELTRLADLHRTGAISDQEFSRAKDLALSRQTPRPA